MNESDFLTALRAIATHPAARDLRDDAAVLRIGAETLILTQDAMAEGVHFLSDQDMADVAWKLVAVNLSDLAAKGAKPVGVLYSHSLGDNDACFVEGLGEILACYDVPLLGGDTISAKGPRQFSLTAIGAATCDPVPSRAGACEGDILYITGPVGGAMIGFETLSERTGADSAAFRRPVPLLEFGQQLAPLVTAMMDVSDGLLLDASRLAGASKVTIDIDTASVPLAAPEERRGDALRWGDDYQLLFTANRHAILPVPAHPIGTVSACGEHPLLIDGIAPEENVSLGYSH